MTQGKRYSIMARQYGANYETELCQCETNPGAIVEAARQKKIKIEAGKRKVFVAKYEHVYARDNRQ